MFLQKRKNHIFFGPGDVGGDFFRASQLRAVLVLRSSLLLYSKGFALFPFKNRVEIAAVEGVAASIDRHTVNLGEITVYLGEITVYFGRNLWP